MSPYLINILSHFSVCIPFFTNIIFLKKIDRKYHPFFYFTFLNAIYDLTSVFFLLFLPNSFIWIPILNINILAEAYVLTWIYKKWGLFENKKKLYKTLLVGFVVVSITEALFFRRPFHANYYSGTLFCYVEALLTLNMLNRIMRSTKKHLHDEPIFIVCIGLLVYLAGTIIPGIFIWRALGTSLNFQMQILKLTIPFITIMYLIFTYALILMAKDHSKTRKELVGLLLIKTEGALLQKEVEIKKEKTMI